jgi:ribosomal protein S18 acetylase RimI-like enzyme
MCQIFYISHSDRYWHTDTRNYVYPIEAEFQTKNLNTGTNQTLMQEINIAPYRADFRKQVLDLVISAWEPVFAKTIKDVPRFVYDNFWPHGWQTRQVSEVSFLLDTEPENFWLALQDNVLIGFIGISIHPKDQMGEVSILAVSPQHQRKGAGRALMDFTEQHIRTNGMKMVMVETVGDSGHESARLTYEALGYERWPVARYFKKL